MARDEAPDPVEDPKDASQEGDAGPRARAPVASPVSSAEHARLSGDDGGAEPARGHEQQGRKQGRLRFGVLLAWALILVVASLVAVAQMLGPRAQAGTPHLERATFEFQARYLVGAAELLGAQAKGSLETQVNNWPLNSDWQRIRAAIVVGELSGPEAALERLRAIEPEPVAQDPSSAAEQAGASSDTAAPKANAVGDVDADADAAEQTVPVADDAGQRETLRQILVRLYEDYAREQWTGPSTTEREQQLLRQQLGWFGQLALAPPQSEDASRSSVIQAATSVVYAVFGIVAAVFVLGLLGLLLLTLLLAFLFSGSRSFFHFDVAGGHFEATGAHFKETGGHFEGPGGQFGPTGGFGGIYVEAFAAWLFLFSAISLLAGLTWGGEAAIPIGLLSFSGSLLALIWPRIRGVPWTRLWKDLGWHRGRGLARELLAGIGGYAMALPMLVLAAILTSVLAGLVQGNGTVGKTPVHPVAEWLMDANAWQIVQLFLLACVAAPVVEETMFRGLLYRHLRELTAGLRLSTSVLLSALLNGLLFAIIHPQGLLGVPAITAIALALAFLREWRGTLLPSIIAHGINNGVAMLALTGLLRM